MLKTILLAATLTTSIPALAQQAEPTGQQPETGSSDENRLLMKIERTEGPTASTECNNVPKTLWLWLNKHKEYKVLYREALGEGVVVQLPDGNGPYDVPRIYTRVSMPTLGGLTALGENTCNNASFCKASVDFGGTVFGDFTCTWYAEFQHPCYNNGQPISASATW